MPMRSMAVQQKSKGLPPFRECRSVATVRQRKSGSKAEPGKIMSDLSSLTTTQRPAGRFSLLRSSLFGMVLVRLFYGVLIVLAVSVLIFAGVQLLPGNAATAILGQSATPDAIRELNLQLGLDKPAVSRYLGWLFGILHGDFGTSFSTREAIRARCLPVWVTRCFWPDAPPPSP